MVRKIIHIDEEKCNGCGACAAACHEGAIALVDGKARLLRDDYCDGMGDCLPECPTGAITFEEREAAAYDAQAVAINKLAKPPIPGHSCPGSRMREREAAAYDEKAVTEHMLRREQPAPRPTQPDGCPGTRLRELRPAEETPPAEAGQTPSQLRNWPVQIKLAPVAAPYFDGAKLLIAADCTAYAYAALHREFMRGRVTLIGCPKLDGVDYAEKLTEILRRNDVKSVTVVRMEVPCCGGLENAAIRALKDSGKFIPWQVITVSVDGKLLDD